MKTLFKQTFAVMIMILVIMCPMVVKADLLQLHSDAYSKYVSVGSEFIYAIEVEHNSFNGTVTFDNNILEVVKVETVYSGNDDVYSGNGGTVTKNINGNQLSVNYVTGDLQEHILVTFKVKSYPSSGTTTVKVKANTNNWFGEPSSTMNIIKPSQCPACPTCEKDEVSCPVCEECKEVTDNKKESVSNDSSVDSKEILLYSALGACGFLSVMVVILAFRRK